MKWNLLQNNPGYEVHGDLTTYWTRVNNVESEFTVTVSAIVFV